MTILLVLVAITPPVAFLIYILRFDRTEPEPLRMVLKILLFGALSTIPAAIFQLIALGLPIFKLGGFVGAALESFLVVAPSEELVKLAVVLLFAWNNRNFNERFDGVIYTGAAAIGFAMAENVLYVLDLGLTVGILRAITSIPGHTFTGVLMGYYVGLAKFSVTKRERNNNLATGFLIAFNLHALYNTLVLSDTAAAALMVPLVVFYFIIGIKMLKKGSLMSQLRWQTEGIEQEALPVDEVPAVPLVTVTAPEVVIGQGNTGSWIFLQALLARIILTLCTIFWLLLIIAIFTDSSGSQEAFELISGGLIITAVPLTVGFLLERSYRLKRITQPG
jgi:protease PrsW